MKRNEKPMKERILEEALQLFSQNGYTGTSMNDIAAKLINFLIGPAKNSQVVSGEC